jgi:hypothetical protein
LEGLIDAPNAVAGSPIHQSRERAPRFSYWRKRAARPVRLVAADRRPMLVQTSGPPLIIGIAVLAFGIVEPTAV